MKTNHPFHSTRSNWVTALVIAASAVALTLSAQAAKPPSSQPCVLFDDDPGDSVQSDVGDGNSPYCNSKKIFVKIGNDGHLLVDHEPSASRNFFLDFGVPITVTKNDGTTYQFQTTDELEADGIPRDFNLTLGAWQSDFNMLTMTLYEQRPNVNLTIHLSLKFPDQNLEEGIFIQLAPDFCEISDPVTVTCTGVDATGKANAWHVDTQDPNNEACVSQTDLTIGLRNLSFGFTVRR